MCSPALQEGWQRPAAQCASELATRHLPANGRGCSASAEGAEPRLQPRITGTTSTRLFQQPIRAALLLLLAGAPLRGVAQQPAAAPPQQDEALVTVLAQLLAASDARRFDGAVLREGLQHPDPGVRRQATLAAGRIGDPAARNLPLPRPPASTIVAAPAA